MTSTGFERSFVAALVLLAQALPSRLAAADDIQTPQTPQLFLQGLSCEKNVGEKVQALIFKDGGSELPPELRLSPSSIAKILKGMLAMFPEQMTAQALDKELEKLGQTSGMNEEALSEIKAYLTDKDAVLRTPPFLEKRAVLIKLANEIPEHCDRSCEDLIEDIVVSALSFWRASCLSCASDFLAAVQGRSRIWVDQRVLMWLRSKSPTGTGFPLPAGAGAVAQIIAIANAPRDSIESKATPLHVPLSADGPEMATLCKMDPGTASSPPGLVTLLKLACTRPSLLDDPAQVTIALKRGDTSCGPAKYYLGCGRPDNTVELTFDKTAFRLSAGAAESRRVGPPASPEFFGNAVLMHEVGHWFGVPHINFRSREIPDLMQGVYVPNGCVTTLSLMRLNNMTNVDYATRFRTGGGLRRPDVPDAP